MSLVEVKFFNISSACYKQPKWVVPRYLQNEKDQKKRRRKNELESKRAMEGWVWFGAKVQETVVFLL